MKKLLKSLKKISFDLTRKQFIKKAVSFFKLIYSRWNLNYAKVPTPTSTPEPTRPSSKQSEPEQTNETDISLRQIIHSQPVVDQKAELQEARLKIKELEQLEQEARLKIKELEQRINQLEVLVFGQQTEINKQQTEINKQQTEINELKKANKELRAEDERKQIEMERMRELAKREAELKLKVTNEQDGHANGDEQQEANVNITDNNTIETAIATNKEINGNNTMRKCIQRMLDNNRNHQQIGPIPHAQVHKEQQGVTHQVEPLAAETTQQIGIVTTMSTKTTSSGANEKSSNSGGEPEEESSGCDDPFQTTLPQTTKKSEGQEEKNENDDESAALNSHAFVLDHHHQQQQPEIKHEELAITHHDDEHEQQTEQHETTAHHEIEEENVKQYSTTPASSPQSIPVDHTESFIHEQHDNSHQSDTMDVLSNIALSTTTTTTMETATTTTTHLLIEDHEQQQHEHAEPENVRKESAGDVRINMD